MKEEDDATGLFGRRICSATTYTQEGLTIQPFSGFQGTYYIARACLHASAAQRIQASEGSSPR